jgi:small basic protein
MDGIKVGIQAIGTFFVAVWNGLVAVVQFVWNVIMAGIGLVVAYFTAEFNMIVFVATFVWNMILAVIMGVINGIKAYIAGVVFVATFIFNQVKGIITGAFNSAKSTVTSTIEGIKSAIGGIISKVKEIVKAVKDAFNPANWKIPNIKIPFIGKNYTGTKNWRGGLTTVAEKGQEIIKPPKGAPFIAQNEMMLNLPPGTEILNNADTQKELTTQPKSNKLRNSVNTSTSTTNVSTSTTSTSNKTSANNISISQVFNVYETGKDSIDKLKSEMRKGVEEVINSMFAGNLVAKGEI